MKGMGDYNIHLYETMMVALRGEPWKEWKPPGIYKVVTTEEMRKRNECIMTY